MASRTNGSRVRTSVAIAMIAVGLCAGMPAIDARQRPDPPAAQPQVPTRVDVTLTRLLGDKVVSAAPFVLMATAVDSTRGGSPLVEIRMGLDVPIGTSTSNVTRTSGAQSNTSSATATSRVATEYKDVGTRISARVQRQDETQFSVYVTVQDSTAPGVTGGGVVGRVTDATVFKSFSTSNPLLMKDGQTQLFGVATDKVTGETLKIEVKLTVLK